MPTPIEQAAGLIRDSESATALTGAGLSVGAGIPPFRGPESEGLWVDLEAMKWAYIDAFKADPEGWYTNFFWPFYNFRQDRIREGMAPSAGHYALKDMVVASALDGILTQNIDGFDRLAGTPEAKLFELHGSDRSLACLDEQCGYTLPMEDWLLANEPGAIPRCQRDDRVLKPDVLLFNEDAWPELLHRYEGGLQVMHAAQTLLLVGTSMAIGEIDFWVSNYARLGGDIVVVDPYETPADDYARLVVRDEADTALPAIRDLVLA